jgi:hypothetical protein
MTPGAWAISYYLVKDITNQQMKAIWKWNSDEIVSQYTKMIFVAHLKIKWGLDIEISDSQYH